MTLAVERDIKTQVLPLTFHKFEWFFMLFAIFLVLPSMCHKNNLSITCNYHLEPEALSLDFNEGRQDYSTVCL